MSDAIEEFGPYIVYEQLGQGGMATVHRAEKRGVGIRRPIALKRLLPHVAADPELVKLFVDEARLASHLHHANVAQTYELGRVGDTFFIAMEYASGPTLSQIVRQCQKAAGDIPPTVTVNIIAQVCEALDYAHNLCDELGRPLRIIHRDVSPANILVSNTGVVKLIDFGIAKATISRVHTQTGFIKGKFGYIAPEYLTGKIDARVDLFAVGVVAHELLAGRRLFEGKDDYETLSNIREMMARPPSHWNPHVPADLDDIVMTALQRDPDKRWQSAAAMQVALASVARDFGLVVGSKEVVEWVEWAFIQVPRESGPMLRSNPAGVDPDSVDTDPSGRDRRGLGRDDNLPIDLDHTVLGGPGAVTPLPRLRRPESSSEMDETVALDRVWAANDLEMPTPPPVAAAPVAAAPPPPPAPWMLGSAEPVTAIAPWNKYFTDPHASTPQQPPPGSLPPPPPLPQLPWITLTLPVVPQPPSSPEQPPSSPERPPSSPERPPSSPERPPSSPRRASSSPDRPPSSPQRSPSSPDRPPSSRERPPSSPQRSPLALERPPSSPQRTPSSSERPPSSPQRTPSSSERPPSSPQRTPSSSERPPSSPQRTPSSSERPPSFPEPPPAAPEPAPSRTQLPWITLELPVRPQPPPPATEGPQSFDAGLAAPMHLTPTPVPLLLGSSDAPLARSLGTPVPPQPLPASGATIPPPREIAMIVIPPGTTFDKPGPQPGEPTKPAPATKPARAAESKPDAAQLASPARKPKPEGRSPSPTNAKADPARAPSTYPIAPRKRHTLLWLILTALALGAGAIAVVYYW